MEVNLGAIRFNWKGAYAGGTAYVADDVVSSAKAGTAGYGSIGGVASMTGATFFDLYPPVNDAGGGFGCMLYLHRPGDAAMFPFYSGTYVGETSGNVIMGGQHFGSYTEALTLDRIEVHSQSSNGFLSGRMTIYGIAHA